MGSRFARRIARKRGLAPGTVVHVGQERAHGVQLRLMDYDEQHLEERHAGWDRRLRRLPRPPLPDLGRPGWNPRGGADPPARRVFRPAPAAAGGHRPHRAAAEARELRRLPVYRGSRCSSTRTTRSTPSRSASSWGKTACSPSRRGPGMCSRRCASGSGATGAGSAGWGPDYLAYSILDAVVDGYYLVLEKLGRPDRGARGGADGRADTADAARGLPPQARGDQPAQVGLAAARGDRRPAARARRWCARPPASTCATSTTTPSR